MTPPLHPSIPPSLPPSNATTHLGEWPPAPFAFQIHGQLFMNILSYGSETPASLSDSNILQALTRFKNRIISLGHLADPYAPTALHSARVTAYLLRPSEEELPFFKRCQAVVVMEAIYNQTVEFGGREIADAEIVDGVDVIRGFVLRFDNPSGETSR
ncbi:hypothetical protein OEA41_004317 [Lepraria neglecta]|uniref:Uncharacterized protein n=1 Tax=Lepraria neglecta TaxID=209136 RepID=A0AAD9YYW6_9LECA|nr:hypothetical protein OEA41_004317 [Lepraria neglecta]